MGRTVNSMADNKLFGNSEQLESGNEKDHVADPGKMVGDLINRQTAIEYFMINTNWYDEDGYPIDDSDEKRKLLEDYFNGVPSVQPSATDTNVATTDFISRQDAVEAMAELQGKAASKSELLGISKAWKRIKSLPSAQPEQADCEYCHEDSDGYVRSIEKNSHAWLVRRGRTMKLRVGFNGRHSECDILFCPMCGRRLTDG